MRVVLTYDDEAGDGRDEILDAIHGWRYRAAVQALDEWLRRQGKNGKAEVDIDDVRTRIREELDGLPLW